MEPAKRRCLAGSSLHVHYWFKAVCLYEIIDFVLAIAPTVPREFVFSGPYGRSQTEAPSASLFGDFSSQSFFLRFTVLQGPTVRNPNLRSCDRLLELHQQYSMIWRHNDRAYSLSLNHRFVFRWLMVSVPPEPLSGCAKDRTARSQGHVVRAMCSGVELSGCLSA